LSEKEKNSGVDLSEDGEDGFDGGKVVDVVLGGAVMVYSVMVEVFWRLE